MEDNIKLRLKKFFSYVFIDGLTGMAWGLFSTLIIGLIIEQIGKIIGGNIGNIVVILGKLAASLTGAGIGVGVAVKYKEKPFVVISPSPNIKLEIEGPIRSPTIPPNMIVKVGTKIMSSLVLP